jgi:hypothetical protein
MTTNISHGLGMSILTLEYKYITYCFKQSCYSYPLVFYYFGLVTLNGITFVECRVELHTLMHYLNVMSISVLVEITVSCSPKQEGALQKNKF